MVKKNLVNKNVIRALSIGLSVAMAGQPLTAMAAESGDNSSDDPNLSDDKPVVEEQQDEAEPTSAIEVFGEVNNLFTTQSEIANAIIQTNEAVGAVDGANYSERGKIDKDVKNAGNALARETDNNGFRGFPDGFNDTAQEDVALIGDVTGALFSQGSENVLGPQVDEKIDAVNETLTNDEKTGVNDIVDEADTLLSNTEKTLDDAEAQIGTSRAAISGATSPEAADAAYEAAKKKVDIATLFIL